ncbi:MAG: hypothetical protein ABEJ66_03985 [Candidatus Nanohaloarchaea archaeon]
MSGSASPAGPSFERDAYHKNYSESTLNSIQNYPRGDHERAVNYPIKWFLEEFEAHAWDLVLKEVPVVDGKAPVSREEGDDLVDADVGFIDLDNRRLKVYQMKPSNTYLGAAEGQTEAVDEFFQGLKDEVDGFGWDYLGESQSATNIPEEEANPPYFRDGYVYGPPGARERAMDSGDYSLLDEYVFGGNIRPVEDNLINFIGGSGMDDLVGEEL